MTFDVEARNEREAIRAVHIAMSSVPKDWPKSVRSYVVREVE